MLVVKGIYAMFKKVKDKPFLFDYAPDIRLTALVNKIKSRTSRLARRDYPLEVSKYYSKPLFWTNSYFLGFIGVNTAEIVEEYIKNQ
mgnify:CR=1 FL=1